MRALAECLLMVIDHAVLQAANLRVSWHERDRDAMISQVANVETIEEAREIILALAMSGDMGIDTLKYLLSNGF